MYIFDRIVANFHTLPSRKTLSGMLLSKKIQMSSELLLLNLGGVQAPTAKTTTKMNDKMMTDLFSPQSEINNFKIRISVNASGD